MRMSAHQQRKADGRTKLRPHGCPATRQIHWAHRQLDAVAMGLPVYEVNVNKALRILGDLTTGPK